MAEVREKYDSSGHQRGCQLPGLVWGEGGSLVATNWVKAERGERILSLPETRHFNTGPGQAILLSNLCEGTLSCTESTGSRGF